MGKDLDYQSPKWEKEKKKELQLFRQSKGQDITLNSLQRILQEEEEFPDLRNYGELYTNLHLKYRIIGEAAYLRDPTDKQCIKYSYLSGVSSILAYLFHVSNPSEKQSNADKQNIVLDFTLGVLQLYAVGQPLPQCLCQIDNPYVQLFLGHTDIANSLLYKIDSQFNPSDPYKFWINQTGKEIIQSVIQKEAQTLSRLLTKRIKEYRKAPIGYSTFIDVYSIAFLKLAHIQNMECDINIIEIPPFFFDKNDCKIDIYTTQVPFFNEAKIALKNYGIDLQL